MKKFSKIKTKSNKLFFSKKEIDKISKKTDIKIKKSIDLAYSRIKTFHSKQNFHLLHLKINIKISYLISIPL